MIQLTRPLVFFDLETTGLDPVLDRIVELAALRYEPDTRHGVARETLHLRLNPTIPISAEAAAVHGIRAEDVAACPTFAEKVTTISHFFRDADLAGYNIIKFDVPFLQSEALRAGWLLGIEDRRLVDAQVLYFKHETRTLTDAVRLYLGREHLGAHGALSDAEATAAVLMAQLERYQLPRSVEELDRLMRPAGSLDREGKIVQVNGHKEFTFGRHKGKPWPDVPTSYFDWMLTKDFSEEVDILVADELARRDQ